MTWNDAVREAIRRFCARHGTPRFSRQQLVAEELAAIELATQTAGATPAQTLSWVLQNLRDEGTILFLDPGEYLLCESPINVEDFDLSPDELDNAVRMNKLLLGCVETSDETAIGRRRKGQERVRALTLVNYGTQCALCDVADETFLVASHIVRWSDDKTLRGDLSNVLCLCRIHDAMFEHGYFALSDDLNVLKGRNTPTGAVVIALDATSTFRQPLERLPSPHCLQLHRKRIGLDD